MLLPDEGYAWIAMNVGGLGSRSVESATFAEAFAFMAGPGEFYSRRDEYKCANGSHYANAGVKYFLPLLQLWGYHYWRQPPLHR